MPFDFKKEFKSLYQPKTVPEIKCAPEKRKTIIRHPIRIIK